MNEEKKPNILDTAVIEDLIYIDYKNASEEEKILAYLLYKNPRQNKGEHVFPKGFTDTFTNEEIIAAIKIRLVHPHG